MRLRRTIDTGDHYVDLDDLEGPLDLESFFGRPGPFELELGSGKGTFLVQEARARQDACLLGCEYMKKYAAYGADRLRRAKLDHARVVGGDAVRLVREHLPRGSFAAVHVYFPDPWPKARHHKRRLVRTEFLPDLERLLAPDGVLRIVTDHPEYAEWIEEVLCGSSLPRETYVPTASAGEGELVGTNFERKYRQRDGRPVYTFQLRNSS